MSNEAVGSNITVLPTVLSDAHELEEALRLEDRVEVILSSGLHPLDGIVSSVEASDECWTVRLDGKVVAIFGVGGVPGSLGVPWMLATDLLEKIKRPFVRECRKYVEGMLTKYTRLANFAWSGNTTHIHWLKWLGFTVLPPVPYGNKGADFHPFFMTR